MLLLLKVQMETTIYYKLALFFLVAFALFEIKCETDDTSEEDAKFVPTEEWQVVKKGQKLPKGLHVRLNLETGEIQAKLLDPTEDKTKAVQVVNTNEDESLLTPGKLKISETNLKEVLKNIKNEEASTTAESKAEHSNKFRSYEQLKEQLSDLNLNAKSDAEILSNLVSKFKKLINANKIDKLHIIDVIEDLDFLVHQYDNAIEFVRLNGFEEIIYRNLNSSVMEIKRDCLRLLGSLVQNNAKVQIYALETGALDFLLRTVALNSDPVIKNRAVFALSSLLRHFPLAQLKFIENAGLNVFFELISSTNEIKIQLKVVTLINDLVLEYIEALDDHSNPEKIAQYSRIGLKHKLAELNWCKYLTILFKNIYGIDNNDHDGIEKTLNAILSLVDDCKTSDINSIHDILENLRVRYSTLAIADLQSDEGLDADYCKHMESLCSAIINYNTIIKKIKTEL